MGVEGLIPRIDSHLKGPEDFLYSPRVRDHRGSLEMMDSFTDTFMEQAAVKDQ